MPKIITISKVKNLTAETNERTSHKGIVPTLGGIGVFTGLLLTANISAVLFANFNQIIDLLIFNILVLLLLLVGVSDDIMNISARKKLFFQVIISLIAVIGTNIYIKSFGGLFGIYELPTTVGLMFSAFVIVIIINAYNLIDGIDGLAGVVGVLVSGFMGVAFYFSNNFFYCLLSFSLVGALVGFLVHNFSRRRKIFLGDTGSMVVGFVLAYQVVIYLGLSTVEQEYLVFKNAPVLVLALLSYPLFDTLRVFCVRIRKKQSPFRADRSHIHHRLLDLGLSHIRATLLVACYTITVSVIAYLCNSLPINMAFMIMLPVCIILLGIPFMVKRDKNRYSFVLPTL
ncbi:MraY family glycosyltransferase [Bizionia sp. KMM 8389]